MPFIIKKINKGYKVCKDTKECMCDPSFCECKSKKPLNKSKAIKQLHAINANYLEGSAKPLTARLGGKVLLKKKIVEAFPSANSYDIYVEPFVGGGSVYFYKDKEGHKEIINDIDPSIITMFNGFKKYDAKEIADAVNGDYDENDFKVIKNSNPTNDFDKFIKTFLQSRLSYFAKGRLFGKPRINNSFEGYKERLNDTIIENKDYKDIIKKYDGSKTFFYLDPPYVESQSTFYYPSINIKELVKVIRSIKGKFLLSIPDFADADELFKGFDVKKITTHYTGKRQKGGQTEPATELLVSNYGVSGSGKQNNAFINQLKDEGITAEKYLEAVKHLAKNSGYDPTKVQLSTDGKTKITYDSPEGLKRFGRVGYGDYILWTVREAKGKAPRGQANMKRNVFRRSHGAISQKHNLGKYSENELAINLLW